MSKKTGSKAKKAVITVLIVLVALVAIVFIGARIYFRAPVSSYYKASEKAFVIPGLMDNMVPQGFDYIESEDMYLICGYQKDGSPSRVYRVDRKSGKDSGYVVMGDENGNGIKPHAGGLAAHGEYLFVAGDEDAKINVYKLSDVLSAKSGDTVKKLGEFKTVYADCKINVAWICFAEDRMIVGEFYRDPNYMTDESHWVTTDTGEENRAIAMAYKFGNGEGTSFGISEVPCEMYSIPWLVQGMTVKDGKIWISQSYGTAKSTIRCYDISGSKPVTAKTKLYSGRAEADIVVPVYAFDSSTQVSSFDAPPMAEEIVFVDGKLLIMSESASMKYFFGNLTGGRWCYATDVSKLS
jgi:hypothetical protein